MQMSYSGLFEITELIIKEIDNADLDLDVIFRRLRNLRDKWEERIRVFKKIDFKNYCVVCYECRRCLTRFNTLRLAIGNTIEAYEYNNELFKYSINSLPIAAYDLVQETLFHKPGYEKLFIDKCIRCGGNEPKTFKKG